MHYDVFNGDADGICALQQLRLAAPRPAAKLITGVKRDIRLLSQITTARNAEIAVLDISLDSNRPELVTLLSRHCQVTYIDHHFAGEIPASPFLNAHIDPTPDICTGLIVNRMLAGRFRAWAVVAAFGDNLHEAARQTAAELNLNSSQLETLQELGELFNYNGYGTDITDLHFPPAALFKAVQPFRDPLDFCRKSEVLAALRQGFADDMAAASACRPLQEDRHGRVYQLPATAWARRVSGVFSNEKARERPDLAHALIVANEDETLRISVRAPLAGKTGADTLCRAFPTGGGRAAAAGINFLPAEQLPLFLRTFAETFTGKRSQGTASPLSSACPHTDV